METPVDALDFVFNGRNGIELVLPSSSTVFIAYCTKLSDFEAQIFLMNKKRKRELGSNQDNATRKTKTG